MSRNTIITPSHSRSFNFPTHTKALTKTYKNQTKLTFGHQCSWQIQTFIRYYENVI